MEADTSQEWRGPLRAAMDFVSDHAERDLRSLRAAVGGRHAALLARVDSAA